VDFIWDFCFCVRLRSRQIFDLATNESGKSVVVPPTPSLIQRRQSIESAPTIIFQPSSCLFHVDLSTPLATNSYILSVTVCPSLDPSINNGTTIHEIAAQYAKFQCLWRCDWPEQCNIVRDSVRCTDASSLASANIFPDLRMRSLSCVVLKMRPRAKF